MKTLQLVQSNKKLQAMRLGITLALAAIFLVALLWVSSSGAPTIASPATDQETEALSNSSVITIGVAAALSGGGEFIGWPQANAVQLAISQTNATGSLNLNGITYTLKVITTDSACDPTQAITAANILLDAGVVAVVGHTCSSASFSTQQLYNSAGVAMVSSSATAPQLTEQGYTTTFRVISRDDTIVVLLATYFHDWLGMDRAAIVEWSGLEWISDIFSDTFTSLGGTITGKYPVASTEDYTATLTTVQAENPTAIFHGIPNANDAGLLSRIAHNQGMSEIVIGWGSNGDLDIYAAAAGAAAAGDYAALSYSIDDMPGYDQFNTNYQAAGFPNYGDEASEYGAFAYDAVQIIIAAMDRADSTDTIAIRDKIATTANYEGVVGTYEGFDAKGDVIPQWAQLKRYESEQWVTLYPSRVFLPLILNNQ